MKYTSPVRAPYFALVLLACSGKTLDVGSDQIVASGGSGGSQASTGASGGSGGSVAPEPPPPLPEWPDLSSCEPSASAPINGEWTGYVQSDPWSPLETNRFRIVFTGMSGDSLCGTVTFGEGEAPPPATDAETNYPPPEYMGVGGLGAFPSPSPGSPFPGLPYTLLSAGMEGKRLQFRFSYNELARTWCPLQPVYPEGDHYQCLPDGIGHSENGMCTVNGMPVSCTQMAWCWGTSLVCVCNADGCVADPVNNSLEFDVHVEGNEASGALGENTVHLERAE